MKKIEDFTHHKDAVIASVAQQLVVLKNNLDDNTLTKEQFDELVQDVFEANQIERLTDSIERKTLITETFELFKEIIGGLPSL